MLLPNERKMIDYYPDFLKPHFQKLVEAEEPEMELAWSNVRDFLKNAYLFTSTEEGISRLEKILKITPKATDTLADRRFALHAALMDNQVITEKSLREQLDALCGKDGYTLEIIYHTYTMKVAVELGVKSQFDAVKRMLEQRAPANMLILTTLRFNTHAALGAKTHQELAAYTHLQLRAEVID